jgi:hypothetical protein
MLSGFLLSTCLKLDLHLKEVFLQNFVFNTKYGPNMTPHALCDHDMLMHVKCIYELCSLLNHILLYLIVI